MPGRPPGPGKGGIGIPRPPGGGIMPGMPGIPNGGGGTPKARSEDIR
jgi:hypothetical protein